MNTRERTELVQATWKELGYAIEATGWRVWVRTLPHVRRIGSIWLPPKAASFHGELPHTRTVRAIVLSAGPLGAAERLVAGDLVTFKRLEFGYWRKLKPRFEDEHGADEEFVGFIDSNHIVGVLEEDDDGGSALEVLG
jgi:hypothetical protein